MSYKNVFAICVAVSVTGWAALAKAASLTTGGSIAASAEPDPTGATLVASTAQPVTAGTFTGTLTTDVYTGDTSNPYGGLTFTYLLSNDATSANSIESLTVSDFTGWLTDVSYQAGAGSAPFSIDRNTADVVGFRFITSPIGAGQNSKLLVVQTDAPNWADSWASVLDGTGATVASLGPVPEPGTLTLAVLGGVGLLIRRRKA